MNLPECLICKTRDCSMLKKSDNETLELVSNYKTKKNIQKGDRLFSEGDKSEGICFIKSGFVKIEINGKQGRPLILQIVNKGTILGHRLQSTSSQHTYSATAVSDVQFCYIPNHFFKKILEKSSTLHSLIQNQILDEIELIQNKALKLAHKTVKEKVADALLMLAEVYEYEKNKHIIYIGVCRQDIADLVGTTKQQVSSVLNEFEKMGIIKFTAKKFTYLNIATLKQISNSN